MYIEMGTCQIVESENFFQQGSARIANWYSYARPPKYELGLGFDYDEVESQQFCDDWRDKMQGCMVVRMIPIVL